MHLRSLQWPTRVEEMLSGTARVETTAPRSSASNGAAERAVRAVVSHIMALRLDLAGRYGVKVTHEHPVWGWLARHAGALGYKVLSGWF